MRLLLFILTASLFMSVIAFAQSEKAERLVVDKFEFAYTFQAGSIITFREGSNGAEGIRFPEGASTSSDPDYRVLAFGQNQYLISLKEARDAGILPAEEQFLNASNFEDAAAWDTQFADIMAVHGRSQSGTAEVKIGNQTRLVPYYSWSVSVAGRKRYALMYVTPHRGRFIAVQVEGSKDFDDIALEAITTGLELIEPAAVDPQPVPD